MKKRLRALAVLLVCISILFSAATVYAAEPLEEAKFLLDLYYVDEISDQARQATSMEELIDAIGDPYTTYLTPEAYEEFLEAVDNEFSGIGVTVEQGQDGILILSVIKGSGAETAGLKPGDIILEADGHILKEMDLLEALNYIKGEEGTFVDLRIKRENEQFDVRIQRSKISLPTVEGRLLEDNIAYIRIYSFGENTDEELKAYLEEFELLGPKGYIIDIRSNGGGYVDTALKIAGYFIGDNVAMLTASKWGADQYRAIGDDIIIDRPVFLLVDMFSASASEILAGALQDYNKALLVGTTTFGKGSMQTLLPLSNEGILKITTNYIYTPGGRSFNGIGLNPDIGMEEGDPYYAALLLLDGDAENKESKQGYMAVDIDGTIYDIDLEQARKDEYWEGYRELIKDALKKGRDIFLGTSEGWKDFKEQIGLYRYYYPEYKELPWLIGIQPDKVFSVTFTKPVNLNTLIDNIYLIDSSTGERINCEVVEADSLRKTVKVAALQLLERGKEYYLVIEEGIQTLDGEQLKNGALCRIIVKE